jgi:23S rRNA (uridine2552-2'-O)-methyltransferase
VLAIDLLPMDALPGVQFVQGDVREPAVLEALRGALGPAAEAGVDVLLSDLSPNLSGMDAIDAPRSLQLAELALELGAMVLKPQGSALIKLFQGPGFQEFVVSARRSFLRLKFLKPAASRARSPETYLLASGRRMV